MIVICPSCETRFIVDEAQLGPHGRKVRCARCAATWTQTSDPDAPPPESLGPLFGPPDSPASLPPPEARSEADSLVGNLAPLLARKQKQTRKQADGARFAGANSAPDGAPEGSPDGPPRGGTLDWAAVEQAQRRSTRPKTPRRVDAKATSAPRSPLRAARAALFAVASVAGCAGAVVYLGHGEIAAAAPQTAPLLERYVSKVDTALEAAAPASQALAVLVDHARVAAGRPALDLRHATYEIEIRESEALLKIAATVSNIGRVKAPAPAQLAFSLARSNNAPPLEGRAVLTDSGGASGGAADLAPRSTGLRVYAARLTLRAAEAYADDALLEVRLP